VSLAAVYRTGAVNAAAAECHDYFIFVSFLFHFCFIFVSFCFIFVSFVFHFWPLGVREAGSGVRGAVHAAAAD
jgi:hypothetical protein